jgi:heparanase 1
MNDGVKSFAGLLVAGMLRRHTDLNRQVSLQGGQGLPPYSVQGVIDLEHPVFEVDPEYLSFALDTSQLVGGKWWNPRAARVEVGSGSVPAPLFDFNRPQLDRLVSALRPAYLRLGGSEADKVYYDLSASAEDRPAWIPPGYASVLTRAQWDAANAFAMRNGLQIIFTLNAGPGARRAGVEGGKRPSGRQNRGWIPDNAAALVEYSARQGYPVAAWELGNELNTAAFIHGPGSGVSASQYAQDLRVARAWIDRAMPQSKLASQGSAFWPVIGELPLPIFGFLPRSLQAAGELIDIITWHYYPQQSRRGPAATRRASPSCLLNPRHLDEAAVYAQQVCGWRDRYAPGKPVWLGETGNAQFGGEPGLSDVYLAGLWWLDQLGLMARSGQSLVVRQTLAGMDYGMLDSDTLEPRPDYWNSLLWKRLMGPRVFRVRVVGEQGGLLRVYAHGTPGDPTQVSLLAINLDAKRDARLTLPGLEGLPSWRYEINAPDLFGKEIRLNQQALKPSINLAGGEHLEPPESQAHELISIHPLSYSFVKIQLRPSIRI